MPECTSGRGYRYCPLLIRRTQYSYLFLCALILFKMVHPAGVAYLQPFQSGGKGSSMAINAKQVGQRIRQRRQTLGISTAKAAADLCISVDHLRKVELGYYIPPLVLIDSLSEYLHVSIDYLVRGRCVASDVVEKLVVIRDAVNGINFQNLPYFP